ncbi:MAG: MFS transporter [Sedimentitalea sp.]
MHPSSHSATRTIALYPWFGFCRNLMFWQAIWFLYFQDQLSASEAILLYVIADLATTLLEVPSGYMSDRWGRRLTLVISGGVGFSGAVLLALGDSFSEFALAQVLLGASTAFVSGTDSALLYESLVRTGREDEVEAQELKAWRFSFCALALSAFSGGVMASAGFALPFLASAAAFAIAILLALRFYAPPLAVQSPGAEAARLAALRRALTHPVLAWLFALSVLMYGFSHIPFVFGQPFILATLDNGGYAAQAPLVSGTVSALMMLLSVLTSLIAPALRRRLGLPGILFLAFGLQIALCAVLALIHHPLAIAVLFLRMVPNSLSKPFLTARIQPLLSDDSRATYMSLQSLCGRLVLAASLFVTSLFSSDQGNMAFDELRLILAAYAAIGVACVIALAATLRRSGVAREVNSEQPHI